MVIAVCNGGVNEICAAFAEGNRECELGGGTKKRIGGHIENFDPLRCSAISHDKYFRMPSEVYFMVGNNLISSFSGAVAIVSLKPSTNGTISKTAQAVESLVW